MTYEYVCEACGHQWEAEQSIKEAPLKHCDACGKDKAKRLVSGGTGFLLKGGGWYADLYSSSSATKAADKSESKTEGSKSATDTSTKGGGDAKSTSESKPAADKPAAEAKKPSTSAPSGNAKAS